MNSRKAFYKNRILIGLILLLAGGLRLYGLNWDDSHHLHPDERFMVMTALNVSWPGSFSEYLNPQTSPLSPYNTEHYKSYIYGTFPLFLTKGLATILGYDTYGRLHLVGRMLSALFDLGSLLLVYLIAARLFSQRAGVLSAALYSVAVMHIQQSHFFTTDNFLVFWMLATFLLLVIFLERERHRALLLSSLIGAGYACALGSKASGVLFVSIIFSVFGTKCVQSRKKASWQKNGLYLLGNTLGFALSAYCVFRLVQPYAFATGSWFDLTPQSDFWRALEFQRRALAGEVMFPSQWQWVNTAPILFPLKNILLWGLGLPLGIASLAGAGLFLGAQIKTVTRRKVGIGQAPSTPAMLALIWILVSFAYGGAGFVKSMRYLLPVTPFLIMFAAYTCESIPTRARFFSPVSAVLLFAGTLMWALAYVSIYSHETTRVAASRWIYNTLPPSSVLANEEWDDPLPIPLSQDALSGEQAANKHFESFLIHVYNPDSADKTGELCRELGRADYIILSSPRARGTIGRLPEHYPIMTRYYQLLDAGGLGFELVKECTSYPRLLGREIQDSSAEESFWVYDHPPVRIYRKMKALSRDDCQAALLNYTAGGKE
jgi:hypothetical protein